VNFVKIKNHGNAVKTVSDREGKRHFIEAGKVATLRPDLADEFLSTHPDSCKKIVLGGVQRDEATQVSNTVWIANMTGNPDCPKKVDSKVYDNNIKRWKKIKVDHPLLDAFEVKRESQGGQEEYLDNAGQLMARNLGPTTYSVDPYQRTELTKEIAEWMLARDARSGTRLAIIKSRAPGELDNAIYDWPVEKLEALVKYIDPVCKRVANTEEKILAVYKGKKALTKLELEHKLFDEQEIWIKRCHFRLANPAFDLPTLFAFESYYADLSAPEVEEEQDTAI